MLDIQGFCGLPSNGSYQVYVEADGTFGRCFLWTTFSYASHLLLAIISIVRLVLTKKNTSRRKMFIPTSATIVAFLAALGHIVEVILSYALHSRQQHPPAYVLAKGLAFASWLLVFVLLCVTGNSISKEKKQDVKYVLGAMVLLILSEAFQIQFIDQHITADKYTVDNIPVDYVGVMVNFSLDVVFFVLCLCISLSKVVVGSLKSGDSREEVDDIIQLGQAESTKNPFSKLVYWWSHQLIKKGFKRQLHDPSDLFTLPANMSTQEMKNRMMETLESERNKLLDELKADGARVTEKTSVKVSLFHVLNRCFGKVFYSLAILKFFQVSCQLVQPVLVNLLVTFVSDQNEPIEHGYYYALGFLLTNFVSVLFDLQYKYHMNKVNLRVRAALVSNIYEKTLRVRSSSLSKFSTGKIVNMMSTDTDRVRSFCNSFHECWGVPFQLVVCMYLLYQQVGIAFVPPIIYCALVIPVATRITKKVKENQMKTLGERDKRIKMICEILFGIRIIKYNVWEKHFAEAVNGIRNRELKFSFIIKLLLGAIFCIWGMTSSIMLLLSVGTYVLMGNVLTAAKVFTTLSVINRLVMPLNLLSFNINGIIDAWVALKRIEEYMCLPEINLNEYYRKSSGGQKDCPDVELEGGSFKWNLEGEVKLQKKEKEKSCSNCCSGKKPAPAKEFGRKEGFGKKEGRKEAATNPFLLNEVSVSIKKGSFVGVTGKVGSGKSSLFASMTGEMEQYGGRAFLSRHLDEDGIAFFTQEPWIQHLSIKNNILFGKPLDDERYHNVISACALTEDLKLFPAGDETEVGENGVNLSGGQKARVALARCVYQDKEMYLLDDPIAAVDAHVAKHIYNNCIMGLLQGKTRVLCTHHTTYLRNADHVILMKDGSVEKQGPPSELLKDLEDVDLDEKISEVEEEGEEEKAKTKYEKEKAVKKGKLTEKEESRVGSVAFKVYKLYWNSYGQMVAITMLLSLALRQAGKNVQDWWLSYWVTEMEPPVSTNTTTTFAYTISHAVSNFFQSPYVPRLGEDIKEDAYYLSIYAYIVLGYLFFVASCAFIQAYGSIRASRVLHKKLLNAVMKTPVSFFDVTPTGRIVNRFSTDISDIDGRLPFIFQSFARQISSFIGTLVLTCISLPWFAALLVPLGLVYYWIQLVYRASSRDLKRIGAVARSPLYEFFTETLSGYMTIRAFRENKRFIAISDLKLDNSQRAAFNEQIAVLWLTFRLDLIGVVMVFAVSLLAVIEHHYGSTNAGMVGLAITYAVQITPILGGMLNVATEMEKQMVRVERLSQYVNDTPQELERSKDVDQYWPDSGCIEFDSVELRYRENLPLVLDDVSFSVRSGEKIGICGRTGSGKSTLLKVLFNILDISGGRILIDGIDIGKIDASILRSRMSIIPQDPFLFDGSVSRNLDPTGQFTTYEMLDVLDKCHLSKLVTDLGGLEGKVGEKGSNLSAGQKQLLCLARALLKKSKIICIDEATASVDLETDKLIQVTIREEFVKSTVLTIAHRMNTIIDSDRVLIMNAGNVLEFASPEELLADPSSEFYALVNENSASTAN